MDNIMTILSNLGITVEEDKKKELQAAVDSNYKTIADYDKQVTKRDEYKSQLEAANGALKNFEGLDPEAMKKQKEEYEKEIQRIKDEYQAESDKKIYEEAVDKSLAEMKFTSEYAKKAVKSEIMAAGLKVADGKLIGLNDMVSVIKEKDKSVFVDEQTENLEKNKAKFTTNLSGSDDSKSGNTELSDIRRAMGLPAEKKED